jgi:hypothetical protein
MESKPHLPAQGSGISHLIEKLFKGLNGSVVPHFKMLIRQNLWRTPLSMRMTPCP